MLTCLYSFSLGRVFSSFSFTCQDTRALLKGAMCIPEYYLCALRLPAPSCAPARLRFVPLDPLFTLYRTPGRLVRF
jgi:hypothetical protein